MTSIKEILNKNNWSGPNCSLTTDKATTHNYVEGFYEDSFLEYKNKKVKVLEIGIASGTSLLLWDEYFTNNIGIYGIDVTSSDIKTEIEKRERIQIIIGNAYEEKLVETLPNFDIMIDDGPHTLESMISFIRLYLPKLNSNGIMVIEDIQSFDWIDQLINTFNQNKNDTDQYEIIDLRSSIGRYDDLMFIIKRK